MKTNKSKSILSKKKKQEQKYTYLYLFKNRHTSRYVTNVFSILILLLYFIYFKKIINK